MNSKKDLYVTPAMRVWNVATGDIMEVSGYYDTTAEDEFVDFDANP